MSTGTKKLGILISKNDVRSCADRLARADGYKGPHLAYWVESENNLLDVDGSIIFNMERIKGVDVVRVITYGNRIAGYDSVEGYEKKPELSNLVEPRILTINEKIHAKDFTKFKYTGTTILRSSPKGNKLEIIFTVPTEFKKEKSDIYPHRLGPKFMTEIRAGHEAARDGFRHDPLTYWKGEESEYLNYCGAGEIKSAIYEELGDGNIEITINRMNVPLSSVGEPDRWRLEMNTLGDLFNLRDDHALSKYNLRGFRLLGDDIKREPKAYDKLLITFRKDDATV